LLRVGPTTEIFKGTHTAKARAEIKKNGIYGKRVATVDSSKEELEVYSLIALRTV